jgi:hypothetical protein
MRRDCGRQKQEEQASEMSSDVHYATCGGISFRYIESR